MPVRVALLGDRSVTDVASGEVRTRSSRIVALLACLALNPGRPQSRQRLAGMFWPDSTDGQALTNLRRELHGLRRVLGGEPCVEVSAQALLWRDTAGVTVDLRVFDAERREALDALTAIGLGAALPHVDAALRHYGGEFLPGIDEEWVAPARADLHRQCVELCTLACRATRQLGDTRGATEAARRLIGLEPLDETGYQVLMEVLAEAGDRAGAVSTYHRCSALLERDLGVTPGPALRATLGRIMRGQQVQGQHDQDQGRDQGRDQGHDSAAASLAGPTAGAVEVALVGRDREFGELRQAWRTAAGGGARLAVVRGDAGVGKTRLVTELVALTARTGAVVASSQCFGTSGRLALAPVADWLRSPVVGASGNRLEPVWRDEVDRLVPSTAGRAEPAGQAGGSPAWQRHRFFEGLARALLVVGRPTLLVLDNLQWCDHETLAFLTRFLGLAGDAPVLVVATLRADSLDREPELRDWLGRMRAAELLTEIPLDPLRQEDTVRLAEVTSGRTYTPAERGLLQAATGGYPLHVIEAMRAVATTGASPLPTADLALVLRDRLAQAGAAAQEIAGLAAAVGRDFSLELLAEASDLDLDAVVCAVDELWRRRILRQSADGYDFAHDLLRGAAYASAAPARRWLWHRRLAQALELLHADDLEPVASQLAEQHARAGRADRAVGYYRQAAGTASGVFAHAEAVRLLDAALVIVRAQPESRDRDRRELDLLEAMAAPLNAWRGYAYGSLHDLHVRSIALAESLGRDDSLLSGLVALWASTFVQGRMTESHTAGTRALSLARPGSSFAGAAHFAVAGSLLCMGEPAHSLRQFEMAAAQAHPVWLTIGTRPDVHSAAFEAHAHWLLGDPVTAWSRCQDAVTLARSVPDHPYSLAMALAYEAFTSQLCGNTEQLPTAAAELEDLCQRYGFGYYREWALVLRGWHLGGQDGLELARRGVANLKAEGALARMPYWLALLADLYARADQADAARSTLDAAIVNARTRGEVWWLPEVLRLRAGYDDRRETARSRLLGAARMATTHGSLALLRRCTEDLELIGARLPA
ncbi:ATP-binding protein [Pseudofrankia saprophytica]|uniref:ATP-binding protein n=1 Tax=Pseudofrankia saprophytica TaxID=298655 RepID=UPI000234BE7A|nr:BTAD domain-containing putative transcriptional regulator [Pseudofrankia saprophytica]